MHHGYTAGCEGCPRLSAGMAKQGMHSEECRKRMYTALEKTEKRRKWMEKADTKVGEYMEAKHEEMQAEAKEKGDEEKEDGSNEKVDAEKDDDAAKDET